MRMSRVIVLFPFVDIHQLTILTAVHRWATCVSPALFWRTSDEAGCLLRYGGGIVVEPISDQSFILLRQSHCRHTSTEQKEDSLWLNGNTVNSMLMHYRPNPIRSVHVLNTWQNHNVY